MASRFGAGAITLSELPERLAGFDIIITSTASSLPILGKGLLERAIKSRRHGYDQADPVQALLRGGGYSGVESRRDLAGIFRVTMGRMK